MSTPTDRGTEITLADELSAAALETKRLADAVTACPRWRWLHLSRLRSQMRAKHREMRQLHRAWLRSGRPA